MTLIRSLLLYVIENTVFYDWHDCGNRGIQNAAGSKYIEKCMLTNHKQKGG